MKPFIRPINGKNIENLIENQYRLWLQLKFY